MDGRAVLVALLDGASRVHTLAETFLKPMAAFEEMRVCYGEFRPNWHRHAEDFRKLHESLVAIKSSFLRPHPRFIAVAAALKELARLVNEIWEWTVIAEERKEHFIGYPRYFQPLRAAVDQLKIAIAHTRRGLDNDLAFDDLPKCEVVDEPNTSTEPSQKSESAIKAIPQKRERRERDDVPMLVLSILQHRHRKDSPKFDEPMELKDIVKAVNAERTKRGIPKISDSTVSRAIGRLFNTARGGGMKRYKAQFVGDPALLKGFIVKIGYDSVATPADFAEMFPTDSA